VFHPRLRAFNFAMRAVAQGPPMAIAVLRVTSPFVDGPAPAVVIGRVVCPSCRSECPDPGRDPGCVRRPGRV
jgi:hypothetical protein